MSEIGILAFGTFIKEPGVEIEARIVSRKSTKTPFPVEFGRRETRNERSGKRYPGGNSPNSVKLETVEKGVSLVLYTDFKPTAKVPQATATMLDENAIAMVAKAKRGMDGISYLLQAIQSGIKTPPTVQYAAEILARTGAHCLEEALRLVHAESKSG